jgi:trimeric autotransporter adhesin
MKRGLNKENSLPDPEFGGESSESARAIHYVVQKDTLMTYEKGLFAQADPGIVSGSTIERKQMSTKTIYKRIALVAVTALGAGVLSVAPANAALVAQLNTSVTSLSLATATTSPTATAAVAVNLGAVTVAQTPGAGDNTTAAFTGFLSAYPAGGFVQVGAVATATGTTTVLTGTTNSVSGSTLTATGANATATFGNTVAASATLGIGSFSFTPTVAGAYTLTAWNDANKDGIINVNEAVQTVNITVAAVSGYSAALSTALIGQDLTDADNAGLPTAATDAVRPVAIRTIGQKVAQIVVTTRDGNNVVQAGNVISATMTGSGFVSAGASAVAAGNGALTATELDAADGTATTTRSATATTTATGTVGLAIWGDGTSGTGTVTITVTNAAGATTTLATKNVSFHGTVATLTATVSQGIATPGTANGCSNATTCDQTTLALTPAVVIVARDSNGVVVPGLTVTGLAADATTVSATTVTAVTGTPDKNGRGFYNASVTGGAAANVGKSTTIVYSTIVSATLTISAPAVTISLGGTPSAVTMTLDKTSYTPGEKVTITVNAKDAAGNNAGDGTYANLFAGASVLGGSFTGSTPAASVEIVGGKATFTAFAPGSSGTYTIANKLGTSAGAANVGKDVTASVVVGASADMSAITTLINSLVAKINALNKLVIKIQKKVRA